jgi:hypothetical protein
MLFTKQSTFNEVVGHVSRTDQNRINLIEFARHRFLLHHFHLAFNYGALDTQHGESGATFGRTAPFASQATTQMVFIRHYILSWSHCSDDVGVNKIDKNKLSSLGTIVPIINNIKLIKS